MEGSLPSSVHSEDGWTLEKAPGNPLRLKPSSPARSSPVLRQMEDKPPELVMALLRVWCGRCWRRLWRWWQRNDIQNPPAVNEVSCITVWVGATVLIVPNVASAEAPRRE